MRDKRCPIFYHVTFVRLNEPFRANATLDDWGYVVCDESCTVGDGIFVAGDCRTKKVRQIATAISDGAIAAVAACRYLD